MISNRGITLSILAILEFQRGDAFLIPGSVSPVQRNKPLRNPVIGFTTTTVKPTSSSMGRSSPLLTAATETVVEGAKQSVLCKAWGVLAPLLLSVQTAAAPALAIAMANEWPINLARHVLTMISVKFVVCAIMDMKRETEFRWSPRYFSAAGLVVAGAFWLDSIFFFPYYIINLAKHVGCMCGVVSVFSIVRSLKKKTSTTKTKKVTVKPIPPPPKPVVVEEPPAALVAPVENEKVDEEEKEEPPSNQGADFNEKKNKAKGEKELLPYEVVNNYLANFQEGFAEFQLKLVSASVSKENYGRAQESITKFQSEKVPKFFRGDDEKQDKK
jgi:hypothetical protein